MLAGNGAHQGTGGTVERVGGITPSGARARARTHYNYTHWLYTNTYGAHRSADSEDRPSTGYFSTL